MGNTRTDSAAYAGITFGALRNWIRKGNKGVEPYAALVVTLKQAESHAIVRNVAIVQRAALDSWQAAAWLLERKRPEDWSRDSVLIRKLERENAELRRLLSERDFGTTS